MWHQLTVQELAVLVNPFNMIFLPVVHGLVMFLRPTAMFNPFSVLSPSWQTKWVLIAIATIEAFCSLHFLVMTFFLAMLALLFFQKCMEDRKDRLKYAAAM